MISTASPRVTSALPLLGPLTVSLARRRCAPRSDRPFVSVQPKIYAWYACLSHCFLLITMSIFWIELLLSSSSLPYHTYSPDKPSRSFPSTGLSRPAKFERLSKFNTIERLRPSLQERNSEIFFQKSIVFTANAFGLVNTFRAAWPRPSSCMLYWKQM